MIDYKDKSGIAALKRQILADAPKNVVGYCDSEMRHITDWNEVILGDILPQFTSSWRMPDSCYISTRQYQITARIGGVLYTGRTFGSLMSANLRIKAHQ